MRKTVISMLVRHLTVISHIIETSLKWVLFYLCKLVISFGAMCSTKPLWTEVEGLWEDVRLVAAYQQICLHVLPSANRNVLLNRHNCHLALKSKAKVNILLYSDPYHWTRSASHCWQLVGKTNVCSVYGAVSIPAYYSLAPQVHERTLTPSLSLY